MILHSGSIIWLLLSDYQTRCLPFHLSTSLFQSVGKRDIWPESQADQVKTDRKNSFILLLPIFCVTLSQEIFETRSLAGFE